MSTNSELIAEARATLAQHDRVWANTSNNPLSTRGVSAALRKMIPALESAAALESATPPVAGEPEREAIGRLVWETSRADEGTISVTGANIIADAILAAGYRREPEPRNAGLDTPEGQSNE